MKRPSIEIPEQLRAECSADCLAGGATTPSVAVDFDRRGLLLHACCAPCSSAIVEWLLQHGLRPTIFYYNPNIFPRREYEIRKDESKRHADSLGVTWVDGDYDHDRWLHEVCCQKAAASVADCRESEMAREPERGRRCELCFRLRLTAAAEMARRLSLSVFTTTLASSRWKSLEQIARAGQAAAEAVPGTVFWAQNWRKGGLSDRRRQLLSEYGFYNQQYCGCEFSMRGRTSTPDQTSEASEPVVCGL